MKHEEIAAVVEPVLTARGLELDALEIAKAGKRSVVRVVVDGDGPEGRGPLLDEIAEATREVSEALDASGSDGSSPYTLEVTSRGVSRPLTKPAHWRRNEGRLVEIEREGHPPLTGRIGASDATGVEVAADGEAVRVDYGEVSRATIQVEFTKPGKEG